MKIIGILVLVVGFLGLVATFGMDTSVVSGGYRVNNFGLMNVQQNLIFVFTAAMVIGVVILAFKNRKTKSQISSVDQKAIDTNPGNRICPFCAESIKAQAVVCRYCGRDVVPLEAILVEDASFSISSKKTTAIERFSVHLSAIQDAVERAYSSLNYLHRFLNFFHRYINFLAIYMVAFGVGIFIFWAFFYDYLAVVKLMDVPSWYAGLHKFYRLEESISIIMAGLIIYFRAMFVKPDRTNINIMTKQTEPKANKSWLPFFGVYMDLVVSQLVYVFLIFYLHNNYHPDIAYFIAIIVFLIGYLLMRSNNKLFGVITLLISLSYIAYRHLIFNGNHYGYSGEAAFAVATHVPSYINLYPYLWIVTISIAFPYMQFLRLGSLRYGNLRGDLTVTIVGRKIFIPFTSALVFIIFWSGFSYTLLWTRAVCLGYFFI